MTPQPAYRFERENDIHNTRDSKGALNWLRPLRWLKYNARKVDTRTVDVLTPLLNNVGNSVVVVIGVGHGDIYQWLWREPGTTRIGIDVNHQVMLEALSENGPDHFHPVEGDAACLPLADCSADIVVFDFSLHHLVGQGLLESFIDEGSRVLRPGGFFVAREPSSYSPSGMALNALNHFGLMHRLTGASNQEFALSPLLLTRIFERYGSVLRVEGLTYFFAHRLPPWLQDLITRSERYLFRGSRGCWVADFLLYVVQKSHAQ